MNKKAKKWWLIGLDLFINLVIIVVLVLIIQTWIVAPFDVSGASMCDTLNNIDGECERGYGEKIIINEALYIFGDPKRGDVVVFHSPNEGDKKYFIKRVIGLPGDILEIKDGEVYITPAGSDKAVELQETYLNEENRHNTKVYFADFSVFEIPEDHYFLMGDNRKASTDSRSCFANRIDITCKDDPNNALVDRDLIRGKAWIVWWPLSNIRIMEKQYYPELSSSSE